MPGETSGCSAGSGTSTAPGSNSGPDCKGFGVSTIAPVSMLIVSPKGSLNRKTALAMVHSLMMSAEKKWRTISGPNSLPEVIQGVEPRNEIRQLQGAA